MSDNIPFDIQIEIIKRVPDVKSLLLFRSVSKPLKYFIDNHKFTHHFEPHRFILSYKQVQYPYDKIYICLMDDNGTLTHHPQLDPTVPVFLKDLHDSSVVGTCNGVFCVYGVKNGRNMVVLWNPSLRKCVGMLVPPGPYDYLAGFAFGVCPATHDPMIVRMSSWLNINSKKVEVFTLSSGVWSVIPCGIMYRGSINIISAAHVVLDRFIYWIACEEIVGDDGLSRVSPKILSFDMTAKVFKVLDLPFSLETQFSRCMITISKLRKSLVLLGSGSAWIVDIDHGAITSFFKLFTFDIPDPESVSKIHGYGKIGEPIIETQRFENSAALEVYSPSSRHIHNLGIDGELDSFFMGSYMETLILHDHPDCFIFKYSTK